MVDVDRDGGELWQAHEGRATYGLVVGSSGRVVECAPYGKRRFLGKRIEDVARAVRLVRVPDHR